MRDKCSVTGCKRWAHVITRDQADFVVYLCATCALALAPLAADMLQGKRGTND